MTFRPGVRAGSANPHLRNDLRHSCVDGATYSAMVGLGETYFIALYLVLGFGQVSISLLATLPILAGSLLQLVSPRGIAWCGSLRTWVVTNATIQAASLAALAIMIWLGVENVFAVFVVATIYYASGQATSPAWNAWIERLVPRPIRSRFLSRRLRICQLTTLVAVTVAGCILQMTRSSESPILAYVVFLTIAGAFRGISAWSLSQQFEEKNWANSNFDDSNINSGHTRVRNPSDYPNRLCSTRVVPIWRIVAFFVFVQFSVYISASFFTPFKLGVLQMTYSQFSLLVIASYVGKIVTLDFAGQIAKRIGGEKLLLIGSLGIIPVAGLWSISQQFWYLMLLQLISGIAWSIYDLATTLVFIERVPAKTRLKVISLFNVGNSTAMVMGAMVGAGVFQILGSDFHAYLWIFVLSTAGRCTAVALFPFNILDWMPSSSWIRARQSRVDTMFLSPATNDLFERPASCSDQLLGAVRLDATLDEGHVTRINVLPNVSQPKPSKQLAA